MTEKLLIVAVIGIVLLFLLVPNIRQAGTQLLTSSEEIRLPGGSPLAEARVDDRSVEMVTLLGFDAIPAILDPVFLTPEEAEPQMDPDEQVLGLSINGEHRAYLVNMLSRHEIVNDEVGGSPAAMTW